MNTSYKLISIGINNYFRNPENYFKSKHSLLSFIYRGLNFIAAGHPVITSLKDKVAYRIRHVNAEMNDLKTAKVFGQSLIQPLRNMPTLSTSEGSSLSGTGLLYLELVEEFRKKLLVAPGKEIYAIAKTISKELNGDLSIFQIIEHLCIEYLQKEWFEKEDVETLENILNQNPEEKRNFVACIIADLFPSTCEFNFKDDGVCAALAPYLAGKYFKGESWDHLAQAFSSGVDIHIRDMFSVYDFLGASQVKQLLLKHYDRADFCPIYDLMCRYYGVQLEPVKYFLIENSERHLPEEFEQKVKKLEKIISVNEVYQFLSQLNDGTYDICILWYGKMAHMLLLHKENDKIQILDPNYGYLRGEGSQVEIVITKLLESYESIETLPGIDAIQVQKYSLLSD